jgi:hypothetical protein
VGKWGSGKNKSKQSPDDRLLTAKKLMTDN